PVVNVFIVSLPIPRLRDAGCCGPRSGAARRLEQSFTGVRLKGGVDLGDREVDTIRWDELPHDLDDSVDILLDDRNVDHRAVSIRAARFELDEGAELPERSEFALGVADGFGSYENCHRASPECTNVFGKRVGGGDIVQRLRPSQNLGQMVGSVTTDRGRREAVGGSETSKCASAGHEAHVDVLTVGVPANGARAGHGVRGRAAWDARGASYVLGTSSWPCGSGSGRCSTWSSGRTA